MHMREGSASAVLHDSVAATTASSHVVLPCLMQQATLPSTFALANSDKRTPIKKICFLAPRARRDVVAENCLALTANSSGIVYRAVQHDE